MPWSAIVESVDDGGVVADEVPDGADVLLESVEGVVVVGASVVVVGASVDGAGVFVVAGGLVVDGVDGVVVVLSDGVVGVVWATDSAIAPTSEAATAVETVVFSALMLVLLARAMG